MRSFYLLISDAAEASERFGDDECERFAREVAMAQVIPEGAVEVRLRVVVYVNPSDQTLVEVINESQASDSILAIVRGEIESNLESVSYVLSARVESWP